MHSDLQLKSEEVESASVFSACAFVKPVYASSTVAKDVSTGLLSRPRSLPSKYFYDRYGSQLFEQICDTPEYYLTRTEDRLLFHHGEEIIAQVRPAEIMELGSGSAHKTRRLFDACERLKHICSYAPMDVCQPVLEDVSKQLQADYDWLDVNPLLGDYHAGLQHLPKTQGTRLYVFLGGTIGNFYPRQARDFLIDIKNIMRSGDHLLLGVDRIKKKHLLDAAYNDKQGITAAFNLNILNVLNRELKADFMTENFEHQAKFNLQHNRIEMHIVCKQKHTVYVQELNETITFQRNDSILTEVSYKFTADGLEELLQASGLKICKHHEPSNQYFSLVLAYMP